MPGGGLDLSHPPVRVWRSVSRSNLAVLLHGSNFYSMGAGGFSTVPALPTMTRLRQPANPQGRPNIRESELYVTAPVTAKQRLESRFGVL